MMDPTSSFAWNELSVNDLCTILASREKVHSVLQLRGGDAVLVVDLLDQAIDTLNLDVRLRKKYAAILRKLCGSCGILPTSHMITEGLEIIGDRPLASGGFSDIWPGKYRGRRVALKSLRTYVTDDLVKVKKRFCKEVLVWKRLSHPNVLPFLGISELLSFPFCMVSSWMTHGNVVEYVKENPEANRLVLLSDVASGLNYLHSMDLVHGDLKGANILINNDYRACLADFGLLKIIPDPHTAYSTTSSSGGGTVRWMSPELLIPEEYGFKHSNPTKESDIYAVGMVIFEVMTGTVPFSQYGNLAVIPKVIIGVRPERPTDAAVLGLSDEVWQVVEDCWHQQWNERPTIRVVLDRLNETTRYWDPQSSTTVTTEADLDDDSDTSSAISDDLFVTAPDIPSHIEVLRGSNLLSPSSRVTPKTPQPPPALEPLESRKKRGSDQLHNNAEVSDLAGPPQHVKERVAIAKKSSDSSPGMVVRGELQPKNVRVSQQEFQIQKKKDKVHLTIVVMGHVDSGKSTTAGHLIYMCGGVGKQIMDELEKESHMLGKVSFKYAWVLDKLQAERVRGVTIDVSSRVIDTPKYKVTVIDTPGHRDFIKNMITGVSQGDAAIVVVSATTGEFEAGMARDGQTREHLLLAFTLGIRQLVVAVNKMDTILWDQERFGEIVKEVSVFCKKVGYDPSSTVFTPVSGWFGDNISKKSRNGIWYKGWSKNTKRGSITGVTLLDAIDAIEPPLRPYKKPLRIPIQHVYNIPAIGTVAAGRVEAGILKPGMMIKFVPANVAGEVKSIERHHNPVGQSQPGELVGFNVSNISANSISRGQVASDLNNDSARETASFVAQLILISHPGRITAGYTPLLSAHTAHVPCRFDEILETISRRDGKTIEVAPKFIKPGDACLVRLVPTKPLCIEKLSDYPTLGRFVVRDLNRIVAVGVVKSVERRK